MDDRELDGLPTSTFTENALPLKTVGSAQIVICPYLALFDDPDTKLLFPSPAGYCHHVTPEQAINLEHQQSFCLNAQHMICAAFVDEDLQVLPAGIERERHTRNNGRFAKIGIILTGLIATLFFGMLFFGESNEPPSLADTVNGNHDGNSMAAIILTTTVPTKTSTAVVTATPMPTDIPPSSTPSPSSTPTMLPTAFSTPLSSPTVALTAAPTLVSSPTIEPLPVAVVIASRLNIRGGPSTNYQILTTVDAGALFDVVGQLSDGTWYQLCCVGDDNNAFGWVLAESVNVLDLADEIPVAVDIPPLSEN